MPSSVSATLKVTAVLLVLLFAVLGLLRLINVVEAEQFSDLALKSSGGIVILGLAGVLIAVLSGEKKTS